MTPTSSQYDNLASRVQCGDEQALAEIFSLNRERLWRMVNFRLHSRLRGRIDPDDVLRINLAEDPCTEPRPRVRRGINGQTLDVDVGNDLLDHVVLVCQMETLFRIETAVDMIEMPDLRRIPAEPPEGDGPLEDAALENPVDPTGKA